MDNRQMAQVFTEIADLLEIKGENVFTIRAYRTAADAVGAWPAPADILNTTSLPVLRSLLRRSRRAA